MKISISHTEPPECSTAAQEKRNKVAGGAGLGRSGTGRTAGFGRGRRRRCWVQEKTPKSKRVGGDGVRGSWGDLGKEEEPN